MIVYMFVCGCLNAQLILKIFRDSKRNPVAQHIAYSLKGHFRVNVCAPVFFTRNLSYIFEKNKTKTNLSKEIELMTSENESLRKNQIS